MTAAVEQAKSHLKRCMDEPDFPVHNCHATCDDLAGLLAEISNLKIRLERVEGQRNALESVVTHSSLTS